jgi:anthranilate synthase component I
MTHVTRALSGRRDLLALAAADPQRFPCLLETVVAPRGGRAYDVLFAFPEARIESRRDARAFFPALEDAWRRERIARPAAPDVPFRGGWVLLLGYEAAAACEPRLQLPRAAGAIPVALALRCPAAIVYDHACDRTILVAESDRLPLLQSLERALSEAPAAVVPARLSLVPREDDPAAFVDAVTRVHEYLRAGDVFQVNLSRGWSADVPAGTQPAALYAALRAANPAPFAGLLQEPGWAVLSSSPERLVSVAGSDVQTRPIAGTRPRLVGHDDASNIRELVAHPKERAEHVMLIDLERNDLGRVCVPGSVRVDELMTVESYAHVHHIVSNVRGTLRAGATPVDVLRAVFPGGTITGCPKVRCMEIIAELEGAGRGPYTGALGYVNRDGDMDMNILIRTLWLDGETVRLRAGSGIVADSSAQRELEETRAKARGLLRALAGDF